MVNLSSLLSLKRSSRGCRKNYWRAVSRHKIFGLMMKTENYSSVALPNSAGGQITNKQNEKEPSTNLAVQNHESMVVVACCHCRRSNRTLPCPNNHIDRYTNAPRKNR